MIAVSSVSAWTWQFAVAYVRWRRSFEQELGKGALASILNPSVSRRSNEVEGHWQRQSKEGSCCWPQGERVSLCGEFRLLDVSLAHYCTFGARMDQGLGLTWRVS